MDKIKDPYDRRLADFQLMIAHARIYLESGKVERAIEEIRDIVEYAGYTTGDERVEKLIELEEFLAD